MHTAITGGRPIHDLNSKINDPTVTASNNAMYVDIDLILIVLSIEYICI